MSGKPPAPKARPESTRANPADGELWRAAMAGTKKLKREAKERGAFSSRPTPRAKTRAADSPAREPIAPAPSRTPPDLSAFVPAGIDGGTSRRLQRGQLPIAGRLDLHGMTQDEAHRTLRAFVTDAARQGKRCLLVITGHGARSPGGGVLRRAVPQWLALSPLAARVLSVATAQPRDGGMGAFYVLLRRADRVKGNSP